MFRVWFDRAASVKWMMTAVAIALLLAARAGSPPLAAEEVKPAAPETVPASPVPMPPPPDRPQGAADVRPIGEILTGQPGCTNFTDACVICTESADHKVACSTPGIACVKGEWKCTGFRFGGSTNF